MCLLWLQSFKNIIEQYSHLYILYSLCMCAFKWFNIDDFFEKVAGQMSHWYGISCLLTQRLAERLDWFCFILVPQVESSTPWSCKWSSWSSFDENLTTEDPIVKSFEACISLALFSSLYLLPRDFLLFLWSSFHENLTTEDSSVKSSDVCISLALFCSLSLLPLFFLLFISGSSVLRCLQERSVTIPQISIFLQASSLASYTVNLSTLSKGFLRSLQLLLFLKRTSKFWKRN